MIGVITMTELLEDVYNTANSGDLLGFRRAVEVLSEEYPGDRTWKILCKSATTCSRSQMSVLCKSIVKHFEESNYE